VTEVTSRLGGTSATIYSVTNDRGFVRSLDHFDKQVFSIDTSHYKKVGYQDLAYNPSRINVGSVALLDDDQGGAVSPMYVIVRCRKGLLPRYLLRYLKSAAGVGQIRQRCEGAVRFQLKFRDLKEIRVPLPSPTVQERIVRLLDEADALRKLRADADKRIADFVPALFQEMFGDPVTNPKGWPVKKLGEVCELVNGAPFKPGDWADSGLPIVRIQNLKDASRPFNCTLRQMPEKYRVRPQDVLLSWSGTPGTSFGCFRWTGPEGWLNQHIFNVSLLPGMSSEFFIHSVNARLRDLIAAAHGGVGLQHITKPTLYAVQLLVPPMCEQMRFSRLAKSSQALASVQVLHGNRSDALFRSMLYSAFEGLI